MNIKNLDEDSFEDPIDIQFAILKIGVKLSEYEGTSYTVTCSCCEDGSICEGLGL